MGEVRLLAISGKRGVGKDTLAARLLAHAAARGSPLTAFAFAAESKRALVAQEASRGVRLDLERLTSDREYKESLRPLLTELTARMLAQDPLVFCRVVAGRIAAEPGPCLITDLRLRAELWHLRSRFALRVVRLRRSDAGREASGWRWSREKDSHPTETELDDPALWDEVLDNDGSLEELDAKARALVEAWLAK